MESVGRCKLCGTPNLGDKNLKLIDDFIKQAFDVILLKLTFDDTTQELICEICFSKLSEAFDFKSKCVKTEDIIFPYVNSERSKAIDLKEIYAMEKIHKQESETLKDWVICRLCFQPVSSKIRDIQDVPLEIIQIYIPEINFAVTTNASICTKCFESLYVYGTFIKSCSAIEDKTNIFAEDILLTNSCIKTEEIKIESEETFEEEAFCEILPNAVKQEEIEEGNTSLQSLDDVRTTEDAVRNVQLSMADYVKYESSLENHENGLSQVQTPNWEKCTFESMYKNYLVQHQLVQKDASEVKTKNASEVVTFKCDKCEYVAKRKSHLASHQLIHKNPSEVGMFKCDECDFETKWKSCLVSHKKIIHRDPSELRMHKCDKCTYESKFRKNLVQHWIIHKDPSEVRMHKCDKCTYESKYKSHLKTHQLTHKDVSEVKMFKCDKCTYESKTKSHLLRHQLIHKDASEVKMFKCDECEYITKRKEDLEKHQAIHRDLAELRTYKCGKCQYESKIRRNLEQHGIMHKDPSEVPMQKCDKCTYKCRYKSRLLRHQVVHQGENVKCDK